MYHFLDNGEDRGVQTDAHVSIENIETQRDPEITESDMDTAGLFDLSNSDCCIISSMSSLLN